MHNSEPNELDQNIDRALISYVDAEPSPSLEYRVLESVHRAAHRKSHLWWWVAATPLLSAVLLVVILHNVYRPPAPSSAIAQSSPTQTKISRTISEIPGAPPLQSKGGKDESRVAKSATPFLRSKGGTSEQRAEKSTPESIHSKGWLTATPAPSAPTSGLTLHDAALVALVRERPDQLRALFAKPDPEPIAPVRIDEIEIKPITTDELR